MGLPYAMARSPALRSLSGAALKVWVELRCRFNGRNNGQISLGWDEAARLLGLGKSTVGRVFAELEAKGFIVMTKRGHWYGRQATTWAKDSNRFSRQDPALIQAVGKAHLWWDWIKSGEVKSLSGIARREGIDKAQVTRWLRLAFLSPTLVRQIRAGAHPTSLTIETLTRQVDLPTNWQEQEDLVAALD